ncbi:hypothetical protein K438DRAFT_1943099 [Mycena galopus ATCC 62051]|nr:hypothetical protein K438DRAFT_1943099 [Mycena galopus ATCC 62051]
MARFGEGKGERARRCAARERRGGRAIASRSSSLDGSSVHLGDVGSEAPQWCGEQENRRRDAASGGEDAPGLCATTRSSSFGGSQASLDLVWFLRLRLEKRRKGRARDSAPKSPRGSAAEASHVMSARSTDGVNKEKPKLELTRSQIRYFSWLTPKNAGDRFFRNYIPVAVARDETKGEGSKQLELPGIPGAPSAVGTACTRPHRGREIVPSADEQLTHARRSLVFRRQSERAASPRHTDSWACATGPATRTLSCRGREKPVVCVCGVGAHSSSRAAHARRGAASCRVAARCPYTKDGLTANIALCPPEFLLSISLPPDCAEVKSSWKGASLTPMIDAPEASSAGVPETSQEESRRKRREKSKLQRGGSLDVVEGKREREAPSATWARRRPIAAPRRAHRHRVTSRLRQRCRVPRDPRLAARSSRGWLASKRAAASRETRQRQEQTRHVVGEDARSGVCARGWRELELLGAATRRVEENPPRPDRQKTRAQDPIACTCREFERTSTAQWRRLENNDPVSTLEMETGSIRMQCTQIHSAWSSMTRSRVKIDEVDDDLMDID